MSTDVIDSRSGPGRRRAAAVCYAGAALIVLLAVAPLVVHWLTNPADQRLVDLDVYRTGGQSVLIGRPVYDTVTAPPQLLPFTYPPLGAVLAVPLAMMSWSVAQWVWTVVIFVALTVTVGYAFRPLLARFGRYAPLAGGVLIAAMAYLMPIRDQVRFGQVDILLVALCLVDCLGTRGAPRRWPQGMLIGLATAVKLTPGVFLIYLWVTGRRRAALVGAGTTAGVTALTFLLLPADWIDYWFGALFSSDRLGANAATTNQSVRGMLLRTYLPDPVTTGLWLVCAAVLVYLGYRAARRLSLGGQETAGVAVTGLLSVAISPVSWIHHLAWLVVVLGGLVADGRDRRRLLVAGGVWLYYVLTIPWFGVTLLADGIGPRFLGKIVQDGFGLGTVALLAVLGVWLPRRHAVRPPSFPPPPTPKSVTSRIRE